MKPFMRVACAAALVTGCASIGRPPTTIEALQRDGIAIEARDRALRDTVIERLVRRVAKRSDRTVDVLMLSGGGQNGAFGAGFLRGWLERPSDAMPRFDLVTGISTGALQARMRCSARAVPSTRSRRCMPDRPKALHRRSIGGSGSAPPAGW
jgi:hypothetical protein